MKQARFVELSDGIFTGKGVSAIENSRNGRSSLVYLFGGLENLPSSVMKASRLDASPDEDALSAVRGYNNTLPGRAKAKDRSLPKYLQDAFSISGKGCQAGALSRFPQNVGRTVVLLYSEPGQTVFDPFAGHNSRMDLCVKAGRHYIGCDLSTEFMEFNQKRAKKLRLDYSQANIVLHHCDSRKVPVKSNSADFTLTSPPYWDIEFYGDEPEQLGKSKTYKQFLGGIKRVLHENFRVLRPGSYAVWFINDFRKDKVMHFYHADILRLGKKVGFVAHDILIVDLGKSIRDCFTNQIIQTRILPKRHEYGIVFCKP